jgi:hypothetical protein
MQVTVQIKLSPYLIKHSAVRILNLCIRVGRAVSVTVRLPYHRAQNRAVLFYPCCCHNPPPHVSKIPLSTPFSHVLALCSSLNVGKQGKIINLYCLIRGYTCPGRWVSRATKFFTVASSKLTLLRVPLFGT